MSETAKRLHLGAAIAIAAMMVVFAAGFSPLNGQAAEKPEGASEDAEATDVPDAADVDDEGVPADDPIVIRDLDALLDSWKTTEEGIVWVPELDCAICHIDAAESFTSDKCIAPAHDGLDCMMCHRDVGGLAEAHETCFGPLASLQTFTHVKSTVCLACHNRETLVAATAASDSLTDSAGRVVNPHDVPSSEEHDAIECGDCHNMHKGKLEKTARAANKACKTCHHKNLYECGTCHA